MIARNLKSFFKHLQKNKLYTTVTLVGFSISLAFVILLGAYLKNEYSVNSQQENKDRIFRLRSENDGAFPPPVGQSLQDAFPEIQSYTRLFVNDNTIDNKDGKKLLFKYLMADSSFFTMFSFNLLEGKPSEVLKTRNSIVLTKEYAQKLFGNESPMGKEVLLGGHINCIITGVVDNIDKNTHFRKCDGIVNFCCLADIWGWQELLTSYDNSSFGLYVLTRPNTNFSAKVPEILEKLKKDFWVYREGRSKELVAEPLPEVYFSQVPDEMGTRQNSKTLMMVLVAIVFSILVLAIINYMNLTVAQSGLRVKETAIKKIVGSSRRNLIYQLINESVLLCFLAFIIAVLLSFAAQPLCNRLLETNLNLANEINFQMAGLAFLAVLILGFVSGIIPALIITRLNVIEVIKGSFRRKSKGTYSKMLIGFQYIIVMVLLMATIIITKQTRFMKNYNMGYNTRNILLMDFIVNNDQKEGLKNRFMSIAGVKNVSFVAGTPIDGGNNQSFTYNGKPVSFQEFTVDSAFFDIMGLKCQKTNVAYSKAGMWLNRKAIKTLELDSLPESFTRYDQRVPVLGVIDDINCGSLHNVIGPVMIRQMNKDTWPWDILVEIEGQNMISTVENIKKAYTDFNGGFPFDYIFIDKIINNWYKKEVRTNKIVGYFTMLTIVIAVMGIFAMSLFYLEQKVKEIGIRKVNGAKISEILALVNFDFVKWVMIAFIVATPVAYFIMNRWLQNFAFRTEVSWWIFIFSGILTLAIAMLTVSWQSWRAAIRKPVEALRYE
jgi:putative ABC transport system permease protein